MTQKLETWLFIVALGHIAIGIALPFVAFSSGFDFYADKIRESFWGGALIPPEAEAFQRWISGTLRSHCRKLGSSNGLPCSC